MDCGCVVLDGKNMQKQIWAIGVLWIYVELFCLLFYKYFYGFGIVANRRGAIAINVVRRQQSVITDVWVWTVPKCPHSQRPTIICKGELKV